MWNICPAGADMGMGVRQEGTQPAEGVSCVGVCRPHQELELNLEGHGGPLQDFQWKNDVFVCLRNIFLAVVTVPVQGEEGLGSWL